MSTSGDAISGHSSLDADCCDDDSSSFVSDSGTRHWIPKCSDEFKPRIGMITSTRSDGVLTHKYLVCSKEGFKGKHTLVDTVNSVEQSARHRRDSRCGCFARMCLNISDGGIYRVYSFEEAHNHWLIDDIDEHGSLSRLFWADHIARGDCIIFGDVVSFDATYQTNKYNLVFVPFIGVDNHHRSVTLAAGLISKEDVESYTWLLTCFKNFVVHDPSVIVTDQDAAMKVAISRVFPTSRHRFCMWHITEKLQSKVGISKCRETGFLNSIKADMYKLRSSWIPIYFRDVTMGGLLRTTSRSKSENSFLMMTDTEDGKMYTIYDTERGNKTFQVNFIKSDDKLKCSCYNLESRGYICRHLFCVMFFMRFKRILDYMVIHRWHKEASRKHNPGLYVEDSDFSKKIGEQIMLSSAIWSHVNLSIRSFGSNVGILQRFHDYIFQFFQENAPNDVASNNTSKANFFLSILDMPQPTEVLFNNPGISKNKGSGKRVRGPREIAMEKLKNPQRLCGYCNERGIHDKRTCPKRLLDEARIHEPTSEPASEYDAAVYDLEHTQCDVSHNS
ncbi:hypothetical protein QQ045_003023 [Rhodiola kirilowii]